MYIMLMVLYFDKSRKRLFIILYCQPIVNNKICLNSIQVLCLYFAASLAAPHMSISACIDVSHVPVHTRLPYQLCMDCMHVLTIPTYVNMFTFVLN